MRTWSFLRERGTQIEGALPPHAATPDIWISKPHASTYRLIYIFHNTITPTNTQYATNTNAIQAHDVWYLMYYVDR